MQMTDISLKRLSKVGRHTDDQTKGLHLWVKPSMQMYWIFRYTINGRREGISLGAYPEIGLKTARQRAIDKPPSTPHSGAIRGVNGTFSIPSNGNHLDKPPTKPVSVVFQCKDESDEKVLSRAQAENDDPEAILIMVKFVEPSRP